MKHDIANEERARELRKDMTPWERKLWHRFLKEYPFRFQRQKCIDHYIADFYCFEAKLVIELDGGGHYESEAERKDAHRTRVLESYGLSVLRFCNTDVDKHFYEVCSVIDREVTARLRTALAPRIYEGGGWERPTGANQPGGVSKPSCTELLNKRRPPPAPVCALGHPPS